MKKSGALVIIFIFFSSIINAAEVDTISIHSKSMGQTFKCVVIRPSPLSGKNGALPVVYLLHGSGGWYSNLITRIPDLKTYADTYKMIIVCPDGNKTSWYIDSQKEPLSQFETYIAKEVPAHIDSHYKTIRDRRARAISGLSMGGHGAMFIALRHAESFGACGSMSGAIDLGASSKNQALIRLIGEKDSTWDNYSVISLIEKYPKDSIAMIIDCGTEDFLYPGNRALHEKMLQLKIPHDYIERSGKHDWPYWKNAVVYQLLFFKRFFEKNK